MSKKSPEETANYLLDQARSSRNRTFADSCLTQSMLWRIKHAIEKYESASLGLEYLRSGPLADNLEEAARKVWENVILAKEAGKPGPGMYYEWHAFAHASWLMKRNDLAGRWLRIASEASPQAIGPYDRFYTEAMVALEQKHCSVVPRAGKTLGWERYLLNYAVWMADIASGRPSEESFQEMENAFRAQNCSRREVGLIDGRASEPARWNFRMESVLHYWAGVGP